jgi:hypothetical protein
MGIERIILVLVGFFSNAGGVFNWDWFMNNYRARFMTRVLGSRRNARIFYIILGSGVAVLGVVIGFI